MENSIYTACAFCAIGAEKICANEIRKLHEQAAGGDGASYTVLGTGWGRVYFQTGLAGLYRALFALRTADRVLLRLAYYDAPDFDALFDGIKNAELEKVIPKDAGIVISKVRSNRSKLEAETSIQAVSHKAAAERLCAAYGLRRLPEPEPGAGCELRVFLEKDKAEILLDLSGAPLFKRGYRKQGGVAPLRETTAAALLLASGWRRKYPLYDPYCGSGTIAIEAALFACDCAPNLLRPFALDRLLIAGPALKERVRAELLGRIRQDAVFSIWGSDTDGEAITTARSNIQKFFTAAGQAPKCLPVFSVQPADKARTYGAETGFVVTNPPYGKRLGTPEEAEEGYKNMAVLCDNFPGWKLAVICDHAGFESFFGRRAGSCSELTNGIYKTYIYQFDMYKNDKHIKTGAYTDDVKTKAKDAAVNDGAVKPEKSYVKNYADKKPAKQYTW